MRASTLRGMYSLSMLTEDQKQRAIELAVEGETLKDICNTLGITPLQLYKYRKTDTQFEAELARARDEGMDILADSLKGITERIPDVMKARLESENMRWLLSRRKPLVYGDRLDVNLQHTVDIGAALAEAKRRAALPGAPAGEPAAPQRPVFASEPAALATGSVPVAAHEPGPGPALARSGPPQDTALNALQRPATRSVTRGGGGTSHPHPGTQHGPFKRKIDAVPTAPREVNALEGDDVDPLS